MQDVTNDGGSVFFAMVFICTKKSKLFCQYVLHLSHSRIIRVTLPSFFSRRLEVATPLMLVCCLLVVLSLHVCVAEMIG